ncbi:hypothetical protein [Photorhabdus akhurstii]|uniref:hypothetical protein n=1 Tax=Photorhabdus akhurstii TaxID=171438 RepID=UPI0037037A89
MPASNKRRGVGRLGRILTLGKTIAGAGKKAKSIQRQGISKSSGLDTLISKSNRTQGTVPVSNKGRGVGRLGRILALGKTIAGTDKKAKSIQKQGISKDSGLDALISKSNRTQGTVPVSNKGRGVGRLGRILALGKTIAGTDKKAKSIQKQGISKDSGLDALISKSNRTQGTVPASNKERGVGRLGRMLALGKTIAGTDKKAKSIQKQGISKDSGLDALISKSNRTQGTVPVNNKGRGVGRLGRMLALGKTIAGTDKKAKSIQKQGISKDSGLDALISKSNRTQGTVPVNNKGRGVGRLGRMLALGKTIAGTDKKAKSIQKQGISKDSGLDALISKSNRIQGTAHINSKSGGNGRLGKILALDSNITEAATSGFTKLKNMGMSLGPSFSSLGSQIINSIGPIGSALEMLGSVGVSDLTLLGDAFSVLGRTMMIVGRLMMANPILAIIGLIAMAAVYIWQNWESLGPKFTQLWEGIKKSISDKWDEIVNDVKSIPEKFKKFGAEIIDGLLKGIIEKWESVKNKFFSITDWFKSWLKGDSKAEVAVKASQEVTNSSTSSDAATVIAATAHDKGGIIPAGRFGIVGEYGPEIIRGPVNVTSRRKTAAYAALGLSVGAMMPFMAAAQTAPLHFQSLPVHAYSEVQERAERNQPQQHREAPQYHIYVYGSPGQSAQDIARMVRHELEQRERMQQARLRSSFSDREDF